MDNPMKEVVAYLHPGGRIDRRFSSDALPISRAHMQFMAACDLGEKWERLVKLPTLGTLIDDVPAAVWFSARF